MWLISATITRTSGTWSSTRQVPTFLLDGRVQGIVSAEHAERVAKDVIDPFGLYETTIAAFRVEG